MHKKRFVRLIAGIALMFFTAPVTQAQTSAFSYQGRLNDNGVPANGIYDLRFTIYDAQTDGSALGVLTNAAAEVSAGLFTAQLDFGLSVFDGGPRWLEIGVRTNGDTGLYISLNPRQALTSTPYAIHSANAAAATTALAANTATVAATANSVSATNISGLISDSQLSTNVALLNATNVSFSGVVYASNLVSVFTPPPWTNQVFGWGGNSCSQLPIPVYTNLVSVSFGRFGGAGIQEDSTVVVWGQTISASTPAGLSNVIAVAAGNWHMLALKADRTVVAWGDTGGAMPPGLSNVVAIAAGGQHSLALKQDGTVVAWGNNSSGQTNVPAGLSNVVAISASLGLSMALKADGKVVVWGSRQGPLNTLFSTITNGVAISAGFEVALALTADGRVVGMGPGGYNFTSFFAGQGCIAIAAGDYHAMALTRDYRLIQGNIPIPTTFLMSPAVTNFANSITTIGAGFEYSGVFFKNRAETNSRPVLYDPLGMNIVGNGSGLTNVNATFLNGLDASSFARVGTTNYIGFGSTNPLARLEIQGGANYDGGHDPRAIAFAHRNGGYRHWIRTRHHSLGSGNAIDFFLNNSSTANGSAAPGTGNMHTMTLDPGRVGIGVMSPTEALDVVGNVKASGMFQGDGSGLTNLSAINLGGTLSPAQIPNFDASKIESGTLSLARLPSPVLTNMATGVTLSGTFSGDGSGLAGLTAAQITSGTLDAARIPSLDASKIDSGTLSLARLPSPVLTNMATGVTLSGTFSGDGSGLAGLTAAQITSGTLDAARIPSLNASKITSGTINAARLPSSVVNLNQTNVTLGDSFTVNGEMRIPGNNTLEFGAGVAGKEANAGKIGYQRFSDGLDIVGAGGPLDRKITFFAEGGSTFHGNVQINGTVTANGAGLSNVPGALPWQTVSGTSQQAASNTGYLAANASQLTLTLPSSPTLGQVVRVSGAGVGGWKVAQNSGQSVVGNNLTGPSGVAWTSRSFNDQWSSIASSADGSKLVGVASGGQIYTSADSGVTWVQHEFARAWSAVASSADGSKLVTVVFGGRIYTSEDSGVTWTEREDNRNWQSVASSADGSKLVAVVSGGQIFTSTNSGLWWTEREGNRNWQSVASSADGTRLVAVVLGGQIYTSTDSGVTWTPRESNRNWQSVTSSANGSRLVAAVYGGQIFTSTDSGVTWTPRESNRNWRSVASSANGGILAAVVEGGQIYTSTDSGVTWTARESNLNWRSVASSADGGKLAAVVFGGGVYTSASTQPGSTTVGVSGYLEGYQFGAIELQFIGNGQWMPVSAIGTILAH